MSKHAPNLRLQNLREITGRSRPEFAQRCRVSPFTIRSIELGERTLTEEIAMKIAFNTGVGIFLLLGETGKTSEPQTPVGHAYTRADYEKKKGTAGADLPEIQVDGHESSDIHDLCHELTHS